MNNEEIFEDYYLKYPEQTGVERPYECRFKDQCNGSPKHELEQFCGCYNELAQENAALIAALKECVEILEGIKYESIVSHSQEEIDSAIERAKKLC